MLDHKTVFILGAGASMGEPFNFPSGEQLLRNILLSCKAIGGGGEHQRIANTGLDGNHFEELRKLIEEKMFTSIDQLLGTYSQFRDIGRFLIASSLLPCEHIQRMANIDHREKNWMLKLFNALAGDVFNHFSLNKVTFITFNYDRTLDYLLHKHLMDVYRCTSDQAKNALAALPIIHVHGSLGSLDATPYGVLHENKRIFPSVIAKNASQSIQIISEADIDSIEFKKARLAIADAERIGIMGFGYERRNMERLGLNSEVLRGKQIFGTVLGLGKGEIEHVRQKLGVKPFSNIELHECTCLDLLRDTSLLYG